MQSDLFREDIDPDRIAQHFLDIVSASTTEDSTELNQLVPDENYRTTFLKLARNLAPTGKTCDRIELRASGESRPVSLDVEVRANINQQLKQKSSKSNVEDPVPEELFGILRALDLNKDWLEVDVDSSPPIRIEGLQDAVDDVIGPMVNRSVIVRAVRISTKKLKFVDIELAD